MQLTRRRSPAVDNNLLYSYPNSRKLLPPTPLLDESRAASRVDGRLESRTEVSQSKVSKQLAGGRHIQWRRGGMTRSRVKPKINKNVTSWLQCSNVTAHLHGDDDDVMANLIVYKTECHSFCASHRIYKPFIA